MDIVHRHFSRSYSSLNKDIILFENPKLNLYTAHFEAVRLSDGKKLIGIRIIKFHSFDPVKDGFSFTGNVYEREIPGVRTEYLNKASAFKKFFPRFHLYNLGYQERGHSIHSRQFRHQLGQAEKSVKNLY